VCVIDGEQPPADPSHDRVTEWLAALQLERLAADCGGRFVNGVLQPYARQRGWSRPPVRWTSW
jgi:hypothetical protein